MRTQHPPTKGRYLAYHWYQDMVSVYYWDGCAWEHELNMTHWMSLPDKPSNATDEYVNLGHGISVCEVRSLEAGK